MKIDGFVGDPRDEAGKFGVDGERLRARETAFEFDVGERGVDGAVADGVDRRDRSAAARFGDEVVPLDAPAERAAAEQAGGRRDGWRWGGWSGGLAAGHRGGTWAKTHAPANVEKRRRDDPPGGARLATAGQPFTTASCPSNP